MKPNLFFRACCVLALVSMSLSNAAPLDRSEQDLMNTAQKLNHALASREKNDIDLNWRNYLRAVDESTTPDRLNDTEASSRTLSASIAAVFGGLPEDVKGQSTQRIAEDFGILFRERIDQARTEFSTRRAAYAIEVIRYRLSLFLVGLSSGVVVGGAAYAAVAQYSTLPPAAQYLTAFVSSGLSAAALAGWMLKPLEQREKDFAVRFWAARASLQNIKDLHVALPCQDELKFPQPEFRASL